MTRGGRAGVTLIELLIAVSLLSLLSAGILMALHVGINAMEKADRRLIDNRRAAGAQRALEQQIAGLVPVAADCVPGPEQAPIRVPFFEGSPSTMRFVSSYSLEEASRGYPRILEFQVIPGERGEGVRLVVNERLYTGPLSTGALCVGLGPGPVPGIVIPRFRPVETGPQSFVLADRLAYCRFSYLETPPPPDPDRWVPLWGLPQLPSAVRIDMAPLRPDPARLQPASLVAPIRVTRLPLGSYAD